MNANATSTQLALFPEPELPTPSDTDLAWAAGFLDGEGCIHIAKQRFSSGRSTFHRLTVSIAQNHRGVLEEFQRAMGLSSTLHPCKLAPNQRRQCFVLNYTGQSACRLLLLLQRFLKRKAREAQVALAFWAATRVTPRVYRTRLGEETLALRERYYQLLKQLK